MIPALAVIATAGFCTWLFIEIAKAFTAYILDAALRAL